jgi:hypothetical protein
MSERQFRILSGVNLVVGAAMVGYAGVDAVLMLTGQPEAAPLPIIRDLFFAAGGVALVSTGWTMKRHVNRE